MWHYLWLLPLGFLIGLIGTLIGAGGGFILVPILLVLYPDDPPEIITSISLAVVFFNALSGSIAYGRMKRIDYGSSILFAAATIPGAVLGAMSTSFIPRRAFDLLLALCMLGLGLFLFLRKVSDRSDPSHPNPRHFQRVVIDAEGIRHEFAYNRSLGVILSLIVGYLSSLLGIGGGIIHVPILINLLNFPVHIATATSHLILAIMAAAGTIVHIATGNFHHGARRTIVLGIGVLLGAPVGARLSNHLNGRWIIRALAVALFLVAVRWSSWRFSFLLIRTSAAHRYNAPVPATIPINKTFLANMTALWRHDPRLAQKIDELPLDASLPLMPSKKGPLTATIQTPDGRTLYLHSRYDPTREAEDFVQGLAKTAENGGATDAPSNDGQGQDAACVILAGLGLGYHLKAIHEHFGGETVVFISEPDLITIKTAFENVDLSKELSTGRVEILTALDKAALHERLRRHATLLMFGTRFAVPPMARDHYADFHGMIRTAIADFAAFSKMSLITLVKNAVITARNVANNLPTYATTPPPDILHRRFVGYPAILVAAGPSLQKNIAELIALQDRAVIIAAQTTLRPLLEHGIRPHFVVSLDFSDLSRQFFEGLNIPDDIILVAEPKASWYVIDTFVASAVSADGTQSRDRKGAVSSHQPGPSLLRSNTEPTQQKHRVILLDNEFARRCIGDHFAPRSRMEPGATVMHLAFYLAQWLGCDPIIFIGQDLAFTGHCYYSPGVVMHRTWQAELGRFSTLEMKEWERIARQRAILRTVKDWQGRDVYTDEQMFTYLEQFERDFTGCRARIIDATQGGARKTGAIPMTLAEATEQFCTRPLDPKSFEFQRPTWFDSTKLQPARNILAARKKELDSFRNLCEQTIAVLDELDGLVDRPAEFNRRIARMDELRTLVQNHDRIFAMVRDVSQLAELQKYAADHRLIADATEGIAKARHQLQRDRRFLVSLLEGCDQLGRIFDDSLTRFDTALIASLSDGESQHGTKCEGRR